MKYTEFEKKVKEISDTLNVIHWGDTACVYKAGQIVVRVGKTRKYAVSTIGHVWDWITDPSREKLYTLATELASTPLEEREEQKKYYYRLPHSVRGGNYLNYHKESNCLFYSTKFRGIACQTQFTREEYEAIAKEHGIPEGLHLEEEVD